MPSVIDEQLETLGDDDLCLLISKFQRVYHNRQRKKNPGCYNYSDLNHFIADCPKKSGAGQNNSFDYYRHRDEGGSNKERRRHKHRSRDWGGRFDKESLKKRFHYKAKKREKAFLAQLSDLDKSFDTDRSSSPTSNDDDKKKKKRDKEATGFIGLCLAAGRCKSFYTMAGECDIPKNQPN